MTRVLPIGTQKSSLWGLWGHLFDVWYHYSTSSSEFTKAELEDLVTAPFTCTKYGDLCELVGEPAAEAWIGTVWARAVAHEDLDAAGDAIWDDLLQEWDDYLTTTFPTGIPDQHDYWATDGLPPDLTPITACGCTGSFLNSPRRDTSTIGTTRVRYRTFVITIGLYNALGSSVERHVQNSAGRWDRDPTQTLSVQNRYSARGVQCDCTWCMARSAQTWRLTQREFGVLMGPGFENVAAFNNGGHGGRRLNRQTSFRGRCP